jgi:hypothetical protein
VYVYDDTGQLLRLPVAWTDYAEPDPFVIVSNGRSALHRDDLLRLAELVSLVVGRAKCQSNDV